MVSHVAQGEVADRLGARPIDAYLAQYLEPPVRCQCRSVKENIRAVSQLA
jgi:hypothetical protein